jgi:hypothetical protein
MFPSAHQIAAAAPPRRTAGALAGPARWLHLAVAFVTLDAYGGPRDPAPRVEHPHRRAASVPPRTRRPGAGVPRRTVCTVPVGRTLTVRRERAPR